MGLTNKNLNAAKATKNDEFYTKYEDVEKELTKYAGQWRGKRILCNCNDGPQSSFFQFFVNNFVDLGIESITAISYGDKNAKKYHYAGTDLAEEPLAGDGSFLSEESLVELKKCDIVATNPPFSLFRDFIAVVRQYGKDFCVIGSKNAIGYKDFFPLLKSGEIVLGNTNVQGFIQPDGTIKKFGNIGWFTTLKVERATKPLLLTHTYSPELYPHYDNFDAIEVSRTSNIPKDYSGVMGVPISFMDKWCPAQFEILGMTRHNDQNMDGGYWLGGCADATISGKQVYRRILIRANQKQ